MGVASAWLVACVMGRGFGRVEKGQGKAERRGEEWAFGPESGGESFYFYFLKFCLLVSFNFQGLFKTV